MPLTSADIDEIAKNVAPRLGQGELSLLLGSGFTVNNETKYGLVPSSGSLIKAIMDKTGKVAGARTSLKDAYVFGQREIDDFPKFLASLFKVERAPAWQEKIFYYSWKRIYTTNIDNVLNVCKEQAEKKGKLAGEFKFFNYSDPSLVSDTIGAIPVITIHGTCSKLDEGFIFSSLEYAKATAKVLDWHRDLAARATSGGLLVIGNQLDESDLDAYIAQREASYSASEQASNWIVMPEPDPIKADNYRAAGYYVFDATAEEFLDQIYQKLEPIGVVDIVINNNPLVQKRLASIKAITWFKSSMNLVSDEIEIASKETGILRHFITGAEPDWFYITQNAQAETTRSVDLARIISNKIASSNNGVGILNVIGPSGSGKTTAIRSAALNLIGSHPYIYEFSGNGGLDADLLKDSISSFNKKSIFIFYDAAEFYYAINYTAKYFNGKSNPYCLFILEDRTHSYARNRRQLERSIATEVFELGDLNEHDAKAIASKIETHGLNFEKFSELSLDRRAAILLNKEKGYGGDLLTALFSLTTHENFEAKIYEEYFSIKGEDARTSLEAVSIISALGLPVPLSYLAGFINKSIPETTQILDDELSGMLKLSSKTGNISCRHRIIADYYYNQCISKQGSSTLLIEILTFLSRQFTVADIKNHPLPYRIYKNLISFEFLYESYFSEHNRNASTEAVYHSCQSLFGTDGIFWLQFGRFYRKTDRLDEGIECFRTGLGYYGSFQTRHALGMSLLERYVRDDYSNPEDYEEGVDLLESERLGRADSDPYPTSALIEWLGRIVEGNPDNEDAANRLKIVVNFALKHFKDDVGITEQIRRSFERRAR